MIYAVHSYIYLRDGPFFQNQSERSQIKKSVQKNGPSIIHLVIPCVLYVYFDDTMHARYAF